MTTTETKQQLLADLKKKQQTIRIAMRLEAIAAKNIDTESANWYHEVVTDYQQIVNSLEAKLNQLEQEAKA